MQTGPEGNMLRQRQITCATAQIEALAAKAVQAAAKMLNVD